MKIEKQLVKLGRRVCVNNASLLNRVFAFSKGIPTIIYYYTSHVLNSKVIYKKFTKRKQ